MMGKKIEIVVSMTGNYIPFSAPLIHSVVSQTAYPVRIHLLCAYNITNRTIKNVEKLRKWLKSLHAELVYYNVEDDMDVFRGQPLGKWASWRKTYYSHYIHLTAPLVLPESVERYIYLDVDMICHADIANLWETDFAGKSLAVAKPCGVEPYHPENFNSGMLLVNLKKWREENILSKLLEYGIETLPIKHFGSDQRILNLYFTHKHSEELLYVDSRWNRYNDLQHIADGFIIHFIIGLEPKPWLDGEVEECMHVLWWYYAEHTPFYKYILHYQTVANKPTWFNFLLGLCSPLLPIKKWRKNWKSRASKTRVRIEYFKDIVLNTKQFLNKEDFVNGIRELCKSNEYNCVLHRHLGDSFYTIATREKFEEQYGVPMHFIVSPRYECLMEILGCKNYSVFPIDAFPFNGNYEKTYKGVLPFVPQLGQPFVTEKGNLIDFMRDHPSLFQAFRWAHSMGICVPFRFKVPRGQMVISGEARKRVEAYCPFDKLILFAPESKTGTEFPFEFWNILAREILDAGYKIIVNSSHYCIPNTKNVNDFDLSLRDLVALAPRLAYIFSIRSGLSDVLVSCGKKMIVFYGADIAWDYGSLRHCFAEETHIREILINYWDIDAFRWEGRDIDKILRKYIQKIHRRYKRIYKEVKHLDVATTQRLTSLAEKYDLSLGKGRKDINNPMLPTKRSGGTPFHNISYELKFNERLKVEESYFLGVWKKVIDEFGYRRRCLFGIPLRRARHRRAFRQLCKEIDPCYDDVYLMRHNLGETFIELSHMLSRFRHNGSKNPLVIVYKPAHVPLYRMYLPSHIALRYVELEHRFVHEFFVGGVMKGRGHRFFCIAPFVVNAMRKEEEEHPEREVNIYRHMMSCMGLPEETPMALPTVRNDAKNVVHKAIKDMGLLDKFVFMVTDAHSLNKLPEYIWGKIIERLHRLGFDVFINETPTEFVERIDSCHYFLSHKSANSWYVVKHVDFNLEEIFYLASLSSGIISTANGLSLFLTRTGRPMDIFFTSHSRWFNYNAAHVMRHYHASNLPGVDRELVREHDMDNSSMEDIVNLVSTRYSLM